MGSGIRGRDTANGGRQARTATRPFRPSYVGLARSGELEVRAHELEQMLRHCEICPRACGVDRRRDLGTCVTGDRPVVASWVAHHGEEPVLSGSMGSGTVFLANCNLRCVFCQNFQISQRPKRFIGSSMSFEDLAAIFLDLQDRGCHNINWVSPTHQVPQLVRALSIAASRGLDLPIVYNTNAYDSLRVLELLDGIVDIYLPDLKYGDRDMGAAYSRVADYPRHARAAITEMYHQVGAGWTLSPGGLLQRGLLVRILVLPNEIAGVRESLEWIAQALSPDVAVSLMAQYYPAHHAAQPGRYPLLERSISAGEWARALDALSRTLSCERCFIQDFISAPGSYQPDFDDAEHPFKDRETG